MLCPYCQQEVDAFGPATEGGSGLRCPRCRDEEVPHLYPVDYNAHPAVPVCILGPTGHGKSVFIDALLHHLEIRTGWPGFSSQWMSQTDMLTVRARLRLLREHGALPDTTVPVFPRPQVLRLRKVPRVGGCQLLFFDNSGEVFRDVAALTDQGRYIRNAKAVLWLVSLTELEYPQQLSDLMTVYAEAMRKMGGDPKNQTVIVVLTKGDLLRDDDTLPPIARDFLESDDLDPTGGAWNRLAAVSAALERWLGQGGHANLVNLLPDLFKAARFCIVSAQGTAADESNRLSLEIMPRGVVAPLFWLWRETLPTVTVDGDGQSATFFSLYEAVTTAPAGAIVRLGPYTYSLPRRLEIVRPITLIGAAAQSTVIACTDGRFVIGVAAAGEIRLADLTVRHEGKEPADVIRIVRGELVLEGCDVTGGLAGEENIPGDGVLVLKDSTANFTRAFVFDNEGNGIAAHDRSKVAIRDSSLVSNKRSGLLVMAVSADVQGCVLGENGRDGATIAGGSRSVLTRNRCPKNGRHAIAVRDSAMAELRGNQCTTSAEHGLSVRGQAVVSAEDNVCTQNKKSGVEFGDRAGGAVHRTNCQGNGRHGVEVRDDANLAVSENDCRGNGEHGIAYAGAATGACENNTCAKNAGDGLRVASAAVPALTGNRATDNRGFGMHVVRPAKPTIGLKNEVRGNAGGDTNPPGLLRRGWLG